MRILITNDDGIHAHGIKVLEEIARTISDDVIVAAPELDQSGVAHSMSLNDPLRLREIGPRHFAVRGTPTDCVIMAVRHLLSDAKPDLVLSGINRGSNVAEDVTYSGTIAGAMEGTMMGIPSIALSLAYGHGGHADLQWDCPLAHGAKIVKDILAAGFPANTLVNVNFPGCAPDDVVGVEATRQGRRDTGLMRIVERKDGRGLPYYWLTFNRGPFAVDDGTDIAALRAGKISVTPLQLDLTCDATLARYREIFSSI